MLLLDGFHLLNDCIQIVGKDDFIRVLACFQEEIFGHRRDNRIQRVGYVHLRTIVQEFPMHEILVIPLEISNRFPRHVVEAKSDPCEEAFESRVPFPAVRFA